MLDTHDLASSWKNIDFEEGTNLQYILFFFQIINLNNNVNNEEFDARFLVARSSSIGKSAVIEIKNNKVLKVKKFHKFERELSRVWYTPEGFKNRMTFKMNSLPKTLIGMSYENRPKKYSENLICIFEENLVIVFDIDHEKLLFISKIDDFRFFSA